MVHPLSLAFLTTFDVGPVEAVCIAAEAGYDRVGLRLLPATPAEAPYPLLDDAAVLRETLAAIRDTGVTIADVEIIRLTPEITVADREAFLERAAMLGARNVLVAGDDPDEARITTNFATLCRLAAPYGLTADLEFMPWTAVPDLATAGRIVTAAGETNGGILVDALHLDRSGGTAAEVAGLPAARLNYVQFCDGPAVYDRSDAGLIQVARAARLVPGAGAIDLVGLARAVPDGVVISVEVPNHELARTTGPRERAAMAIAATRSVLEAARM